MIFEVTELQIIVVQKNYSHTLFIHFFGGPIKINFPSRLFHIGPHYLLVWKIGFPIFFYYLLYRDFCSYGTC